MRGEELLFAKRLKGDGLTWARLRRENILLSLDQADCRALAEAKLSFFPLPAPAVFPGLLPRDVLRPLTFGHDRP